MGGGGREEVGGWTWEEGEVSVNIMLQKTPKYYVAKKSQNKYYVEKKKKSDPTPDSRAIP